MTPVRARPLADWAMLLALAAFWGSNFMFVKLGVSAIPPATLVAARLVVGALIMVAVVRALGHTFPPLGPAWGPYVVLAVVGNCLPFWFITWGQQHIDSALAGVLMGAMPLMTLLIAHRFAAERATRYRTGGFVLGFLGVIVLMSPAALSGLGGAPSELLAQVSVLCGALCYAANSVIARVKVRADLMVASAATVALAALISIPVALALDRPWRLDPDWRAVALVLWIGVGPTAIATFIYFALIRSAGPTFMSMQNYLTPCVALVAGMMLLGEQPGASAYAGLLLILAGIGVSQVRR
jgi:drug/metabolite transporter (DMT)-like permease